MKLDPMQKPKPYKGVPMEGMLASWYAKNTGKNLAEFAACAKRIAADLPSGTSVLEVAPGPGYLAIELAKCGSFHITGLDISRSFVDIAKANATRAGVAIDFRQGDAAAIPFPTDAFDYVVCRAAFKNFSDPVGALREIYRVLKPRGRALIIDMRKHVSDETIGEEVDKMQLGTVDRLITKVVLGALRKRAYTYEDFAHMLAETPFHHGDVAEASIGYEVRLTK